jgi:translation elongation factor EF-Ts
MSTQQPAMQIPAHLVKELRERTGAGFSDCRAALVEANGVIDKAIEILRKRARGELYPRGRENWCARGD